MDTNKEVLEMLSNIRPVDEGQKAEYIIYMPGKLLCITRHWIESEHHVMVNVEGMSPSLC